MLGDGQALETASSFQFALESSNADLVEQNAREHIRSIQRILPPSRIAVQRPWSWVIGGTALVIGLVTDSPYANQGAAAAKISTDVVSRAIYAGHRYVVAESLRNSSRRMRPRPPFLDESRIPNE